MHENKFNYVIPGEPLSYRSFKSGERREFDEQSQARIRFSLMLENLHGARPFYSGDVHLDVFFYFSFPQFCLRQKSGSTYVRKARLSSLIKFVEEAIQTVVSKNNCNIASLNTKKFYDNTPRTEFTITEIKNDKENKKD